MRECIVTKMDIIKRYQIMSSFFHIGIPEKNIMLYLMSISKLRFRILLYLFITSSQGDNKTRKATIMVRTLWRFRESSLGKRTARRLVSED